MEETLDGSHKSQQHSAANECRASADGPAQDARDDGFEDDLDSAFGDDEGTNSTASLSESILEYRQLHGRTYHNESHGSQYWGPNDDRSNEAQDIGHHTFLLLLENKLHLAPLRKEEVHKVLDVGTGTGTWAIDFADEYPAAEVIGTDISPIQSLWTPPNCRFEIDDAERPWTFEPNSFDYIHMRTLTGSIQDWPKLFLQAYDALKPGGWIESYETEADFRNDDVEMPPDSPLRVWPQLFVEASEKIGREFRVILNHTQSKGIEAAGFNNIHVKELKSTIGDWSTDPVLKRSGVYALLAFEQDLEGYLAYTWCTLLGRPIEEMYVFLADFRKALRSKTVHAYLPQRIVYAQKPLDAG